MLLAIFYFSLHWWYKWETFMVSHLSPDLWCGCRKQGPTWFSVEIHTHWRTGGCRWFRLDSSCSSHTIFVLGFVLCGRMHVQPLAPRVPLRSEVSLITSLRRNQVCIRGFLMAAPKRSEASASSLLKCPANNKASKGARCQREDLRFPTNTLMNPLSICA